MAIQDTPDPLDEVPELQKFQINFTSNDLVTALMGKAQLILDASARRELETSETQPAIAPEVQPHAQRIKELAAELKIEIDAINQIDPNLLNRMKQR
jgi:hypothetical protein